MHVQKDGNSNTQNWIHEEIKSTSIREMLATILFRVPCLPVSSLKKRRLIYTKSFYFLFYGCEAWSLTVKEEQRLRVFKNRVVRRIFGPKREKVEED
jgi:hypothetical protein